MGKIQFKKEDTYTFYKLNTEVKMYTQSEEIILHVVAESLDKRIGGYSAYLRLPLVDYRDLIKVINTIEDALGYMMNQKIQRILDIKGELDIYNYNSVSEEEEEKIEVKDENQ